ncbi:MAG: matrixin family metalloprotease [Dehalococcoidales bacterium]
MLKKKYLLLIVTSLVLLNVGVSYAKPKNNLYSTYQEALKTETSSVTGKVLSLQSRWSNTTECNTIISEVTLLLDSVQNINKKQKTMTFQYEGGTVNGMTLRVITNPGGEIKCEPGNTVRVYLINNKKKTPEAIKIDILSESKMAGYKSYSPSQSIFEESGCNFEYCGPRWWSSDFPVTYRVNSNTEDLENEEELVDASFATWENHGTSYIDFTDGGSCETTEHSKDGHNDVYWDDDLVGYSAYCYIWDWFGHMQEFDIEFNDDIDWCDGEQEWKLDVQSTCTHEIGHTLYLQNLNDDSNDEQTMYYRAEYDEIWKRTLNTGDEWGAQFIYPDTTPASITINEPESPVAANSQVTVQVYVSSPYSITQVKFKAADAYDFDYDSGWVSMSPSGIYYEGTWNTPSTSGDYYVTIRVKDNQDIYAFKWKMITVVYQ